MNIKHAQKNESKYLSPLEKALAKEYTNPNPEEIAMLPGQMTLSKYHLGH